MELLTLDQSYENAGDIDVFESISGDLRSSDQLRHVFDFLVEHSHYNRETQRKYYEANLRAWEDNGNKLRSLLHATSGTQARGSLDGLAETWKRLHLHGQAFDQIRTLDQLVDALKLLEPPVKRARPRPTYPLDAMWHSLSRAQGFGDKTAALFVKALVDVHTLEINNDLRFLDDFRVDAQDVIRVPVDSVITYIFRLITGRTLKFATINEIIRRSGLHRESEATIWDDLWFWGFITQHGGGESRQLAVNEAKFWSILGSPKKQWSEIRLAAEKFIGILDMAT